MASVNHQEASSGSVSILNTTPLKGIMIKIVCGKTLAMDVVASDTVGAVKNKIQDKEGFPPDIQKLVFSGKAWRDNLTLGQIGTKDGEEVYLVLELGGGRCTPCENSWVATLAQKPSINIIIRTATGKEFELESHPTDVVWKLKLRIQDREGIPAGQQRLLSDAGVLNDDNLLAQYNLSAGSIIRVQSTAFESELSKLLKKVEADMKKFMLEN